MARAQIAALTLRLPDPPPLSKGFAGASAMARLADELRASGFLAKTWDESKHNRWPAGSDGSVGGRFAPNDGGGADAQAAAPDGRQARITPVGYLKPDPNQPLDPDSQRIAAAINALRAGDGVRDVKLSNVSLHIERRGARISLSVNTFAGSFTLVGDYSDPPGVPGVDITGVTIKPDSPGVTFQILPNKNGE